MSAKAFSTLAACLFAFIALVHLARALVHVQVTVAGHVFVPTLASWIAFGVFAGLAALGFAAKR